MERLYGFMNSINLLSSLSLAILWINRLANLDLLSGAIRNNYIALTAVYAPAILFVMQCLILLVSRLRNRPIQYYQQTGVLFSFVNMMIYLLFLACTKYF